MFRNFSTFWSRCLMSNFAVLLSASYALAQSVGSLNWSGAQLQLPALSDLCTRNGKSPCFNVTGSWVVPGLKWRNYSNAPSLSCDSTLASCEASMIWIGIGSLRGQNGDLLQVGTFQSISRGTTGRDTLTYYAFYEMLPAPRITVGSSQDTCRVAGTIYSLAPGDSILAQITAPQNPAIPGATWTLSLTNHSSVTANNWSWSCPNINYQSNQTYAEWIVEAPNVAVSGTKMEYPLANFGRVGFSEVFANQPSTGWKFDPANLQRIFMTNPNGGRASSCKSSNANEPFVVAFGLSTCVIGDFNSDGISDLAWRDATGNLAWWLMDGVTVLSSGVAAGVPSTWSIVGQRDFNGDGAADLLWRDNLGNTSIWFMNGTTVASSANVGNVPSNWSVAGVADFDGDGIGDLLWRDASGNLALWLMNSAVTTASAALGNVPTNWTVAGTGDFDGDGMADIVWRDNLGNNSIWFMNGTQIASAAGVGNVPATWSVVGTGDFNGDGMSDIVWRDGAGNTAIWLMNGAAVLSTGVLGNVPTTWSIAETGDYNGDGASDLLWRDVSGNTSIWYMNGTTIASTGNLGNIPTGWAVQSVNAE
jgi:FG-GAP-like repeat